MLKSLFPWKPRHKTKVKPTMEENEVILQEPTLQPCHICGRTFVPVSLKRHQRVCERQSTRRRKPFDSLRQRVEGTDLAPFHQRRRVDERPPKRPAAWKERHLELVTAIRAAKGVAAAAGGVAATTAGGGRAAAGGGATTERCPSCDRRFGPKAFDRHVEWCRERRARLHPPPSDVLLAKERLEARTKYKVPPLGKSKRQTVREKYSGHEPAKSPEGSVKGSPLSRGPSVRKPRSLANVGVACAAPTNGGAPRADRGRGGRGEERAAVPVIGSPAGSKAGSVKSCPSMKKAMQAIKKINSVDVNKSVEGLTVSALAGKKMVTWRDTVKEKNNLKSESTISVDSKIPVTKKRPTILDKRKKSPVEIFNLEKTSKKSFETISNESNPSLDNTLTSNESFHFDKNNSCNSMAEALEGLKIDSSASISQENDPEAICCSKDKHKNMCMWFEAFVSKNEFSEAEEELVQELNNTLKIDDKKLEVVDSLENIPKKDSNVVCLFQSTTNLDLTREDSVNNFSDKKSFPNFENLSTDPSIVLTISDLDMSKSNFSLKKSFSNIDLKKDSPLISIFNSKENGLFESETCLKIVNSMPNIHLSEFCGKNGEIVENKKKSNENIFTENSTEEIVEENLQIKAIEKISEDKVENEKVKRLDNSKNITLRKEILQIAANEIIKEFLDDDYTVPKKKRRIDSHQTDSIKNFSENFQNQVKRKNEISKKLQTIQIFPEKSTQTNILSRPQTASSNISDISPRTFFLLDKILTKENEKDSTKKYLKVTPKDCKKLLEIDKVKLPKIELKLKEIKEKNKKENRHEIGIQVDIKDVVRLPEISENKLGRFDGIREHFGIKKSPSPTSYDPFESAQRQFMELLECDDFKPFTPSPIVAKRRTPSPTVAKQRTPSPTVAEQRTPSSAVATRRAPSPTNQERGPAPAAIGGDRGAGPTRASVIDPPVRFKDSLDSVTDDFEALENMINDECNGNTAAGGFFLNLGRDFAKRKYSDDMSSIDPNLINENDDLSLPETFKNGDYSPTSTVDTDITIQNSVDEYSVEYDSKIEAIEPKVEKKPLLKRALSLKKESALKITPKKLSNPNKINGRSVSSFSKVESVEKKKKLPTLKRSMTLFDPSPKPPSLKTKQEVDSYLEKSSKKEKKKETVIKAEDLFAVDDAMYEEYKKYEEMYLKEKEGDIKPKNTKKNKNLELNYGILTASEEETDQHSQILNKLSNDSAYGSLTRKTPKHRARTTKLSALEQKQVESTSSSGSENGLTSPSPVGDQKMSKFCHECGTKFPVSSAKFCIECGVKRLVL